MKRASVAMAGLFFVASLGAIGCGKVGPSPQGGGGDASTMQVKTYSLDALPAVGDMMPPLDDGRVRVAPPENWRVLARHKGYVAVFCDSATGGPPRIVITAEDALPGGIQDVTPDNVKAYAAEQAKLLSEKTLREPVKPMVFGTNAWARHVRRGKYKTSAVERQILTTVSGGRSYTIELQVYDGDIPKYRDPAYAVAAAIEFVNKSAPAAETPPADDGASDDGASDDGDESSDEPAAE